MPVVCSLPDWGLNLFRNDQGLVRRHEVGPWETVFLSILWPHLLWRLISGFTKSLAFETSNTNSAEIQTQRTKRQLTNLCSFQYIKICSYFVHLYPTEEDGRLRGAQWSLIILLLFLTPREYSFSLSCTQFDSFLLLFSTAIRLVPTFLNVQMPSG